MSSDQWWLVLAVGCLVALIVLVVVGFEFWKRDYRSVTWARLKGPVWARNYSDQHQLLAYCLHRNLMVERDKWEDELRRATPAERHVLEEVEKIHYIVPTFVYARGWDEDHRVKLGVGRIEEDAFALRDELVHRITGYWPHQMSEDAREGVYEALIPLERDLYIPYGLSGATPLGAEATYQKELSRYPSTSAQRFLLDTLRLP